MRWARLLLFVAVLGLAAVRVPAHLTERGLVPCWLFLPALLFGFLAKPGPAVLAAWSLGLATDLLSLEPLGVHAFLFGAAVLLLVRVRGHLYADHGAMQGLLALGLTLAVNLGLLVRLELAEGDLSLAPRIPAVLLLSLITGALVPPLIALDRRIGLLRGFREADRRV